MPFFIPAVISAVTTAAAESAISTLIKEILSND